MAENTWVYYWAYFTLLIGVMTPFLTGKGPPCVGVSMFWDWIDITILPKMWQQVWPSKDIDIDTDHPKITTFPPIPLISSQKVSKGHCVNNPPTHLTCIFWKKRTPKSWPSSMWMFTDRFEPRNSAKLPIGHFVEVWRDHLAVGTCALGRIWKVQLYEVACSTVKCCDKKK